jgi:DNA-binding transcriptional ArsR family regulator
MVNNQFSKDIQLDKLFGALADSHRRTILANLTKGPMTATQIANQLPISAPATSKHLKVLEQSGLVTRTAEGRIRRCKINIDAIESAEEWIQHQREVWNARFDNLEKFLEATKKEND